MDDQPTTRETLMDRDRVADEQGREHTGGLGERAGAATSGGAVAGTRDAERMAEGDEEDDEPSDAERRGLGDIGQYGDAAATGEAGAVAESTTAEGLDRVAEGDLGASPPMGADEQAGRATSQTGGLDADDAPRTAPGRIHDAQTDASS